MGPVFLEGQLFSLSKDSTHHWTYPALVQSSSHLHSRKQLEQSARVSSEQIASKHECRFQVDKFCLKNLSVRRTFKKIRGENCLIFIMISFEIRVAYEITDRT
jgi:hypothetical protein